VRRVRRCCRLCRLAIGLALFGSPTLAAPFPPASGAALARLVVPADRAVLAPGGVAWLAWEPLADLAVLGEIEEWEAFLSLDGGRTWPLRITPHLDLDLRGFAWRVPELPAADVRLLLRFGDERREHELVAPQRFSIAGPPAPLDLEPVAPRRLPGEAARPGEAGVVVWVEGTRRGEGLRRVAVAASGLRPAVAPPESGREPLGLSPESDPEPAAVERAGVAAVRRRVAVAAVSIPLIGRAATARLSQLQRLNL
jgi:hypothetical protein